MVLSLTMARKKKGQTIKFPGSWENLHVLARNLEGESGTHYGYVIITVSPEPDTPLHISHNYEGADKYNKKLIRDVLEELADYIGLSE